MSKTRAGNGAPNKVLPVARLASKLHFFGQMLGHAKPGLPANAEIFEAVLVVFSHRLKTEITLGLQVRTGRSDRVVGQR